MALATGMRLGPYEIQSPLGAGGMGEVYRARDARLERDVALKVLPAHLANDSTALERLQSEAKALAAISHRNIVTVFDIGTEAAISFVVMELLRGESLQARIARSPLPWREAVQVGMAIAEGLDAAHTSNVIHGDLKPDNVFLADGGAVKILDFGLARFDFSDAALSRSRAPTLAASMAEPLGGTMTYMAPELIRGSPPNAQSDLFACGCLLYAMLSGAPPFDGGSVGETLAAILRDPMPRLGAAHAVPPALEQLIAACLSKDPGERLRSARQLWIALEAVARGDDAVPLRPRPARRSSQSIDSLAILPLAHAGADPEVEYLCDGLTDRLIDTLSRLPGLRVMARATVFRYKGRSVDPQRLGRDLHVRATLTGRVVPHAQSLTLEFELVDTRDGARLWGEQFRCELCDIMELQETLAHQVTEQLRPRLLQREKRRLRPTQNTEAFRLYLQGRFYWNKRSREGLLKSIEYFELSQQQDPRFALAHAGLADAYALLGGFSFMPPQEAYAKAKLEAARALELDPTLAEAHVSIATVRYRFDWDWEGAEKSFRLGLKHNSGYATGHHWYAVFQSLLGRFDAALASMDRAIDLDPLSIAVNWSKGYIFYYMRRYAAAIEQGRQALAIDPTFAHVHVDIGLAHVMQGDFQAGIEAIRKGIDLLEPSPRLLAPLGYAYGRAGDKQEARRILADLVAMAKRHYVSPFILAMLHVGLDEVDPAFAYLEQSLTLREDALVSLTVNPRLDPLRSDPRFATLLQRVGLPALANPVHQDHD